MMVQTDVNISEAAATNNLMCEVEVLKLAQVPCFITLHL
jgi:hypothetical protein